MASIAVYSCVTGDYDDLKDLSEFVEPEVDYYFFTNNRNLTSDFWHVVYIDDEGLDNVRLARKIKVLGHPILEGYDVTVWLDGASYLRQPVTSFIDKKCDLKTYSLVGFAHRERDSIYQEALECIKVGKDNKEVITAQVEGYKADGYPDHDGLIESTVMVRRGHDATLQKTMEAWFEEIKNKSRRDQLSFNYVARKTGLSFNLLPLNVFDNEFFGWAKHPVRENDYRIDTCNVIYGADSDFSETSYWTMPYQKHGGRHLVEFEIHKACSEFKIELMKQPGGVWSDLAVECESLDSHSLVNWCNYYGVNYFDGGVPTLFCYGNFSEGDHVCVSIRMNYPEREAYLALMKRLNDDLVKSHAEIDRLQAAVQSSVLSWIRRRLSK